MQRFRYRFSILVLVAGCCSALRAREPSYPHSGHAAAVRRLMHTYSRIAAPDVAPRHMRLLRQFRERAAEGALAASGSSWIVDPVSFGADPTGRNDSTAAFTAAVATLLARNSSGHADEAGTVDLGGATLDLLGGDYLISAPLVLPSNFSNFRVVRGTLRASKSFPNGRYLIELGTPGSTCINWGNSCNENVDFEDLFLDGSLVAAGGIQFVAVIGVSVGPSLFVLNYTVAGLNIQGGHEVMVTNAWLGEYMYTGANWTDCAVNVATGILIDGNDHYVTDTIVFAGAYGVAIYGAANILTNVHTWNCPGAVGIYNAEWQNRFIGCYLDYVNLVLYGPALTTVTGSFFLGPAHIVVEPGQNLYPIRGVYIAGNQYAGLPTTTPTVELNMTDGYAISEVQDVTITGALTDGGGIITSTAATRSMNSSTPITVWTIDFSSALLFPTSVAPLQSVQWSFVSSATPGSTQVTGTAYFANGGSAIKVVTDSAVAGTVTVSVDQSLRTGP